MLPACKDAGKSQTCTAHIVYLSALVMRRHPGTNAKGRATQFTRGTVARFHCFYILK